jgi:hypothetical protein
MLSVSEAVAAVAVWMVLVLAQVQAAVEEEAAAAEQ